MPTRTTTRRSAVVLTLALVAMLLVALGGSARAAQNRVTAGTGHSSAATNPGRHAAAVPPAPNDQNPWHLDLAATPPLDALPDLPVGGVLVEHHDTSVVTGSDVTAVGRAPPAP